MDATAAATLNEGLMLLRGFVDEVTPVPSVARPALWAARYKFSTAAWADKAEQYLSSNMGSLSLEEQSKYRTAIVMARDVADQSPKHIDSLVTRIGQQLQGNGPSDPAPKPGNVTAKPAAPAPTGNAGMLILIVVLILALKG